MKLFIFSLIIIILLDNYGNCDDLLSNRTYPRSRYSFRNRKSTTSLSDVSEMTTTAAPITTTPSPLEAITPTSNFMEVLVASKPLRVTNSRASKTERRIDSEPVLDADHILKCGNRSYGDTPWIAVLEHKDPTGRDSRRTLSKGVLISSRHVLTTISSIHNSHPFWVVSRVRLGDYPTWVNKNLVRDRSKIQTIGVNKIFQHNTKDIAIIQLNETVTFGDFIQPACLPINSNYNYPELYLHMCKKTRGHDHTNRHHSELISVKSLSPQDCSTMFHRKGAVFTDAEFCAWDEFGDTCTGDIGGPLMAQFYGQYIVIGLNSFAITNQEFDATDYPGVYVNIGYFIKWIDDIISLKEY